MKPGSADHQSSEAKDLVVFDILRESKCADCGKELLGGNFLFYGGRTTALPHMCRSRPFGLPAQRRHRSDPTCSGLLLLSFAMGMVTGLGIKTPFDYSVFSAAAAAFLLAFWEPDRFTLDKLLNRSRNEREIHHEQH